VGTANAIGPLVRLYSMLDYRHCNIIPCGRRQGPKATSKVEAWPLWLC